MTFSFEVLLEKIGFSRMGRVGFSNSANKRFKTPIIAFPLINTILESKEQYFQDLGEESLIIISEPSLISSELIWSNNNLNSCLFYYPGTTKVFIDIFKENFNLFESKNILAIIPFNNPTTAMNRTFALKEIRNQLKIIQNFLNEYPHMKFGITIRLFEFEDLFDEYIELITFNKNIVLLNFSDIFDDLVQYRSIVKVLLSLKSRFDRNLAIMASGKFLPKHYPFLIYLGIDIINDSYSMLKGADYFYDTTEHLVPFNKIRYLPCSCKMCNKLKYLMDQKNTLDKAIFIGLHNLHKADEVIKKIRQYLLMEDFRTYVEKCCLNDLNLVSALKIIDKEYYSDFRNETPITQDVRKVKVLGPCSYERPDFVKFRENVLNYFEPEPYTRLIVLLPCSAKKPYSESKSHRHFLKVLKKYSKFHFIQEIILTSPLGAIPRQLERIYPANCYDISVTGYWDEEELQIASRMLVNLIKKYNTTIPVICHLDGQYLEIISRVQALVNNPIIFTHTTGGTTSREALLSLENTVTSVFKELSDNDDIFKNISLISDYWTRSLVKIIDYQFGTGTGKKVCKNGIKTRINRANTQLELIDDITREKIGTLNHKTGQLLLTLKGAERLMPDVPNALVFNGNKVTGTTLFRPGIIEFADNIAPEINIIVLNNSKDKIIGVGTSLVSVNYLINSKNGRVAKIYEKAR
ncbi:MAG: DUF5591 domain-containing protein [Candidatus Lokiarchaeota archaeon]|nr:DUF5591 domain-containing protein [Candidatus Lokiarchaeota archaeon]